ncbi:transposase [Bradyrhizobium sp. DASA03005]|uniref:transposase n=1 Tax=Bradyrhizobium sp. SPXBL-02 TaxID=3395912 RepID=UPI003F71A6D3
MAEALEPEASKSGIAHRIGIHPSQLFAWRRDARIAPARTTLRGLMGDEDIGV